MPPSRLLLVEDDALVARSVCRVLKLNGFEVRAVASCADVERLDSCFNAGVFDIDLGDGDGVSLAEDMLARGLVKRAIFFTASNDAESHRRAIHVGEVVSKMRGTDALLRAVSTAVATPELNPQRLGRAVGDGLTPDTEPPSSRARPRSLH